MIPTSKKDFLDKNKTISVFRGSKDIYLYQKLNQTSKKINFQAAINSKVGVFFSFGGS